MRVACADSMRRVIPSDKPIVHDWKKLKSAFFLAEVPGSAVSANQAYREADLAIDFCEDVKHLPPQTVDCIKMIFEEEGVVAKISSIHVNGWFGNYDKLTMTRIFSREIADINIDSDNGCIVFVGDSPNEAPMVTKLKCRTAVKLSGL